MSQKNQQILGMDDTVKYYQNTDKRQVVAHIYTKKIQFHYYLLKTCILHNLSKNILNKRVVNLIHFTLQQKTFERSFLK